MQQPSSLVHGMLYNTPGQLSHGDLEDVQCNDVLTIFLRISIARLCIRRVSP